MSPSHADDGSSDILREQLAYYRAAASEYEGYALNAAGEAELIAAITAFRPTGDVLELACGPGVWTEHLAGSATTVTGVDAAPEMLSRAMRRVRSDAVRFIEADVFSWQPDRRYDAVFFGFWLSHVPEERFEEFWALVADCLEPHGCVFFFDDNHRTAAELIEGASSSVVQRRLNDGTAFKVLKIPYQPAKLEQRLRALSWDITVTPTSGPFYWGTGRRDAHG